MQYEIEIKKKAAKFILKQSKPNKERILKAIHQLPNDGDIKALQNNDGLFRLRVGEFRIIYKVDHGKFIVIVIDAGNRGEIYNRYN